jgi:aspartate racemase
MKTVGVLGGMGPAATVDFVAKLVAVTAARCDAEHIPCIVINDPRIPDRTDGFLSGRGAEIAEALRVRLRRLEDAGADGFVMPCNSAHHWAEALTEYARIPLLHIADASLEALRISGHRARRIAIMGTPVTLGSGFYQRRIAALGIEALTPDKAAVAEILAGIRLVKAGQLSEAEHRLTDAASRLFDIGADTIIMACTEIPLALARFPDDRLVDSTSALAHACMAWAISGS